MSDDEKPNRVWVELEPPTRGRSPRFHHDLGHQRAKLASAMLVRLGAAPEPAPVWWSERDFSYAFTIDSAGGFVTAGDCGHWFNLDYFGREEA